MISTLCQNLAGGNIGVLGTCFIQMVLFGDLGLAALMIFSVFLGFIVRYNLPGNLIIPLSVALTYVVYIVSGSAPMFLFLFIISLVINGVLMGIGILNYINR